MARLTPVAHCVTAVLLLGAGSPVAAQTLLEEVVVTATRTEKLLKNSPYSISVITREELQRFNQDQLADLVSQLPGIHVSDAGQAGQKRIRIRGEESRRMALLIDGQEFIDHREVGVPLLVDSSRIQRVELVRGPASVLYGPKAMGGVINVITESAPTDPFNANVSTTYNSATNGTLLSLQMKGLAGGRFGWSIGGFSNNQHDRESPAGTVENTDYDSQGVNAGLSYRNTSHKAGLSYEHYASASSVFVEPDVRFTPPFVDFHIDSPRRDREKVRIDYAYSPLGTYLQTVNADVYHQISDREFNTFPSTSFVPGIITDTSITTISDLTSDGFNLQADFQFGESFSTITGIQWVRDEINQKRTRTVETNSVLTSTGISEDQGKLSTTAVYVQGDIDLTDRLALLAGIRAYDVSGAPAIDDQHTITSIAFVYEATDQSTLRFSYAQGYIFPSLLNLVVGAYAGSSFIHPVPGLEPETSDTMELGYRFSNGQLSVDSVLFYTQAENYIDHVACSIADNCLGRRDRIYRNVGEADSHGIELSLGYARDAWQLRSSLTWMQRKKIYEGVDSYDSGIPIVTGSLRLQYSSLLWKKPVSYALTTRFETGSEELVSTVGGMTTASNSGYGVTDFEVFLRPLNNTSVTLTAGNLGDKAYHSATENLLAPGRHLRLKLAVSL